MRKTLLLLPCILAFAANLSAQEKVTMRVEPGKVPQFMSVTDKVVDVKPLGDRYRMVVKESANGGLYKTVESVDGAVSLPTIVKSPVSKVESSDGVTLYENFNGYDGVAVDWLPEGWTEVNSSEELAQMNDGAFTWHATAATSSLPAPIDGKNYCIIYYANYKDEGGKKVDLPQDEWLMSPVFTPVSGDKFSFHIAYNPLYLFNMNNEYIDWGNMEFKQRLPATTLKVYIREDSGEWQLLKDLCDDWDEMPLSELFNEHSSQSFFFYEFPLADYVGKASQVAFQFVGMYGNTMELDAVKVAMPKAEAGYSRPSGAFYYGLSENYKSLEAGSGKSVMVVPAYTDLTWTNVSSENSETFSWTYSDPVNPQNNLNSAERDLVVNYPATGQDSEKWYSVPSLMASAGESASTTYAWDGYAVQSGGEASAVVGGNTEYYGMANYDIANDYFLIDTYGYPLMGWQEGLDAVWKLTFGLYKPEDNAHVYGLSNTFSQPLSPYVLSRVRILGEGEIADDAKLDLTIYQTDKNGNPRLPIAVGTCMGSDIIKTDLDGKSVLSLPFVVKNYDYATQETNDDPVIIKDGIMVLLTGFDSDKVTSFAAYQSKEPADNQEANGAFWYTLKMGEQETNSMYSLSILEYEGQTCYSSFLFTLDAAYPWLECTNNVYEIGAEGGELAVELDSFYDSSKWNVATAADWLTWRAEDGKLVLIAEQYATEDKQPREAEVTVGVPVLDKTISIKVIQSPEAGISVVENSDLKVCVKDGNFYISTSGAAVTKVDVFNSYGMLVRSEAISGATTIVPTDGLSRGVYVLRFDNGATVKVVK